MIDFKLYKPNISLKKVVKINGFPNFNLMSFKFVLVAVGASIKFSCDLFGGLLGPLGASWAHPGELFGAPLALLEGFVGGKTPKIP